MSATSNLSGALRSTVALPSTEFDALICGAGPVGLLLANLLGMQGVSTLVVEKRETASTIPRAIGLCEEGSRALQIAGLLDGYAERTHRKTVVDFVNEHDEAIIKFDIDGTLNGYPRLRMFFQPELEAHLRKGLDRFSCVHTISPYELSSFVDDGRHVDCRLRTNAGDVQVRSRFLFGCDGANSTVRSLLGVPMKGSSYAEPWLIVDAEADPQPSSNVVFSCDPDRPGVTMSAPNNRRRWEFLMRSDENEAQVLSDDFLAPLLERWGSLDSLKISRRTVYSFEARVAARLRVGRVFLLGDAAHLTPPFLGQGLMAGFRDALNLAWKVAGHVNGRLGDSVLDSYEAERRPHATQVVYLAKLMGSFILPQKRWSAWLRNRLAGFATFIAASDKLGIRKTPNHIRGNSLASLLRVRADRVGFEVPQYPLRDTNGRDLRLDDVLAGSLALVSYGDSIPEFDDPELEVIWKKLGGRRLILLPATSGRQGSGGRETLLVDWQARYASLLGKGRSVLVVRPDLMIVANLRRDRLQAELKRYLLGIANHPSAHQRTRDVDPVREAPGSSPITAIQR